MLINAGQTFLNWGLTFICHFLPPLRCNYDHLFNEPNKDWTRFSEDGTKIGAYSEVNYYIELCNVVLAKCITGN